MTLKNTVELQKGLTDSCSHKNIHDYNTYKKCYQSDFYYKNLTCKKIKNKLQMYLQGA